MKEKVYFKVIKSYPDSPFKIGETLKLDKESELYCNESGICKTVSFLRKYPNYFDEIELLQKAYQNKLGERFNDPKETIYYYDYSTDSVESESLDNLTEYEYKGDNDFSEIAKSVLSALKIAVIELEKKKRKVL
jgi:hypothetical protein